MLNGVSVVFLEVLWFCLLTLSLWTILLLTLSVRTFEKVLMLLTFCVSIDPEVRSFLVLIDLGVRDCSKFSSLKPFEPILFVVPLSFVLEIVSNDAAT